MDRQDLSAALNAILFIGSRLTKKASSLRRKRFDFTIGRVRTSDFRIYFSRHYRDRLV